jgi:RNA-directed DNA polymerase
MSQLQRLKSAQTLRDVAELLDFQPKMLAYILYKKPPQTKYTSFTIPKRMGGVREISAPSEDLMLLQRHLSDLLQDCMDELKKANRWDDKLAHGFKRGSSIVSNGEKHRKRRYVFNLDLEDFFGSINFGRVRGFFMKDRSFALPAGVATILAQIACHDNALPQGSPCSPVISNLVGHIVDLRLGKLAFQNGCTYSRYADDITFSTNERKFPADIAIPRQNSQQWQVGAKLESLIERSGFSITAPKNRMQYRESRQEVTGLVVNSKVNVRREYRHSVRAMAHRLFMTGEFQALPALTPGTLPQLHGMIGHIDHIDRYNADRRRKDGSHLHAEAKGLVSKEILYRRFLVFKEFYCAIQPTVLCEGKTDNVYIKHAIKSLAAHYPGLIATNPTNQSKLKIRIFKYTNTSTGRVLKLEGGTGQLKNFISHYANELKRFKAPGMAQPIMLLIDNDSGSNEIYSTIKTITKKAPDHAAPYIHIVGNLYLVATPLKPENGPSAIEDFFDDQTKAFTVNGKTFDPKKEMDTDNNYGKAIFSQLVEQNASKIDFSGFGPILDRLSAVIEVHAAKAPQNIPAQLVGRSL